VPITFYCPECTQKLRIDDDFAGKLVACTRCGSRLRVPLESQSERSPREARPQKQEEIAKSAPPVQVVEVGKPQAREETAVEAPREQSAVVERKTRPVSAPRGTVSRHDDGPEVALMRPAFSINVEELIDMTAMVDIVFFLLIFFLVTSMKAIDSTVPMPAPDPQKAGAREPKPLSELESDNEYIVVHIDKNDRITVNDVGVQNDRDLLFRLRELRTSGSRPDKMLVVGHGDATHGTAVMIMDTGREAGIEHVRLAVADEAE
jgi:biopolymer transport protein ExbD